MAVSQKTNGVTGARGTQRTIQEFPVRKSLGNWPLEFSVGHANDAVFMADNFVRDGLHKLVTESESRGAVVLIGLYQYSDFSNGNTGSETVQYLKRSPALTCCNNQEAFHSNRYNRYMQLV